MPTVNVNEYLSFSPRNGVSINEKSLSYCPDDVFQALRIAFSHMDDKPLIDACCGGTGPLAGYSEIDYPDYLEILRETRVKAAGDAAKAAHTRARRAEFNSRRSHLVLAMLNHGIQYVCAEPGCGATEGLTVDHIKALSRGGTDDLDNLRFLCLRHNSAKRDRDMRE